MRTRELGQAVGAEWTKLWSVRSTWLCLAGAAMLMVASALMLGGATARNMLRAEGGGTPFRRASR